MHVMLTWAHFMLTDATDAFGRLQVCGMNEANSSNLSLLLSSLFLETHGRFLSPF